MNPLQMLENFLVTSSRSMKLRRRISPWQLGRVRRFTSQTR